MLEKAKAQAMKYLLGRMRSEKEIRQYLYKKHYDHDIIEAVIAFLYQYQYLDDLKFCEAFINDRINLKPCGRRKIRQDLREKGVKGDIIDLALEKYFPYETECEAALRIAERKTAQNIEPLKIKQHLAYKGFDYELIESIMDKTIEYGEDFS